MAKNKREFGVRLFQPRTGEGSTQAKLAEKARLSVDPPLHGRVRADRSSRLKTVGFSQGVVIGRVYVLGVPDTNGRCP